ncbi:MAG TPA: alpha/beta fold hydrolase [Anaerolineales bacterium]|nr:alpha/beta fold hydrolase [Anaerolineales bacterium]
MEQETWIGHTLGGRYKITALLGTGGMSAVYKATDPNLNRVVAVKLIHPHLSKDKDFITRFKTEAAAVAAFRHANIVQVHDFNFDGEIYYMVMEYIDGDSLQDILKRLKKTDTKMPLEQVVNIIMNVNDALGYAHKQGMIHRDIKPANIMLTSEEQPVLMDFGLVKILNDTSHTATGAIMGTARYMPPEIIRNEDPDASSDIYSLGISFYEMLTGTLPFSAKSAMSLMMMHINDPVPDLSTVRPDLPPELIRIVNKSLEKNRSERYSSADEMTRDLERFLSTPKTVSVSATEYGYLNLKIPGGGEQEFEVSKSEITVGRAQTNDIVIEDAKMSRAHARFEFNNKGEVRVIDTGSTNGIRVNGIKVDHAIIKPGDIIQMGESQIQYESLSDEDDGMTIINSELDLDKSIAGFVLPTVLNETSEDRIVIFTPDKTWEVLLDENVESLTIGRDKTNDVVIDHPSVSRSHARITRDHRTFKMKDLNSSNGLYVAGTKTDEVILESGMNVLLGYANIVFKSGFTEEHLSIAGTSFKIPDRNPVVFLPGIMGSELWLGEQRIWPNIKLLFKDPDVLKYPGIPGIEPRGILQEVVVVPNLIKLEQYSQMGDYLVEDLGYTRGVDFFEFAYDWRQDVRLTAKQLSQFIDALPVKPPIKLVAHSLGTLVSRYYVERYGGKHKVDKLILMGGPHLGTPAAVSSLLFGPNVLPFGIMGEALRKVLSTFYTSYQILPVYDCGVDQLGKPYNFMKDDGWLAPEQLALWQAAREFKQELGFSTSVPTTCIFGYGQKTVDRIMLNRAADNRIAQSVYESKTNGDGSVPENSAILKGADFHPVHQLHGVLFVDNDVKMRLRLELIGKPFI